MEKVLRVLEREGALQGWSDAEILPGQSINEQIQNKLSQADIIVFLLSNDFFASNACIEEWDTAKKLASGERPVFRIPIVIRECPWIDFLDTDDRKALPEDGQAVSTYNDPDIAWQEVYRGIKTVVTELRATHTPKPGFLRNFDSADIPTARPIQLNDIFVFPRLTAQHDDTGDDDLGQLQLADANALLQQGNCIIHGQDKSGKTALAKHLFLTLARAEQRVLFVDLDSTIGRFNERQLQTCYAEQFNGDYAIWQGLGDKTLIVDNVSEDPRTLEFIDACTGFFERIVLLTATDTYQAFFMDEIRLARYRKFKIEQLTRRQQERLIRKRLATFEREAPLTDEFVDQAEDRVNSVIITNKIVPRYPFFVLAILQTYDTLMRDSMNITSYGHCYYIFIVASLRNAGISEADESLNAAFNFASQLAKETFLKDHGSPEGEFDFEAFKHRYQEDHFTPNSLLNRLTHERFGIITKDGRFRSSYMYYYFLGKVVATDPDFAGNHLESLCDDSFVQSNYLTLLFSIHHATDAKIIEEILIRTMIELSDVPIATLNDDETSRFASIVRELPESVRSQDSVEKERAKARDQVDELESELDGSDSEDPDLSGDVLGGKMLRVLKNNKILGQVLRNQYGNLTKRQIEEIVETIADSSFRLVNSLLSSEDEIHKFAGVLKAERPDADLDEIHQGLRAISFLWTLYHIEQAVHAANVPSIHEAVERVVRENGTLAYQIFGYFCDLDNSESLTMGIRDKLARLVKDRLYDFVGRVASLRTQHYLNTHRSKSHVEQAICSVLKLKYDPRQRALAAATYDQS
ncbi:TIR domain-containing protein [Candidatus Poriferisodalis sp.]|uniref:TIR domain-containing protein n=1 Tax=Candidatus Poriferisodalis sp. TaxID=3101277 RepID=UPI003B58BD03